MIEATLIIASLMLAEEPVNIQFRAVIGQQELTCGKSYPRIGTTKSTITPRDFRLYVHNIRLLDEAGREVPVQLTQDNKWQLDGLALLDFEDATGACRNGTPDMNRVVTGTVPTGVYRGLRFTLGVPDPGNHSDPLRVPAPLNLTAMAWTWTTGRTFARLDFSSTGAPRGYTVHLGSSGCTPNGCASPNRPEITLANFDPAKDLVFADLAALLQDSNVDQPGGCMSDPNSIACGPIFANFGLPFAGQRSHPQAFFRAGGQP